MSSSSAPVRSKSARPRSARATSDRAFIAKLRAARAGLRHASSDRAFAALTVHGGGDGATAADPLPDGTGEALPAAARERGEGAAPATPDAGVAVAPRPRSEVSPVGAESGHAPPAPASTPITVTVGRPADKPRIYLHEPGPGSRSELLQQDDAGHWLAADADAARDAEPADGE